MSYLARGLPVEESVGSALATAGKPVVFAGGIVVVAILGLAVAGVPFMTAGGIAISVVVLVMVVASVTLLPALLGLAGHRINRRRHRPRAAASTLRSSPGWSTLGPARDPQPVAVRRRASPCCCSLSPRRCWRCAPASPTTARCRRAGPSARPTTWWPRGSVPGSNGPLVVAVDIAGDPTVVDPLVDGGRGRPGDRLGARPARCTPARRGVARRHPDDRAAGRRDARRRSSGCARTCCPACSRAAPRRHTSAVRRRTSPTSAHASTTGSRCSIAAVLAMSFVLLMLVFRSVLVPLKAVVLNLLSIGAAYGVMVMVFQWGWGAGLIGLESTVPIVSFIPMFMFAILFGLSMDYEVFLLSRVREEYVATGDNQTSIVDGIAAHRAGHHVGGAHHDLGVPRLRPRARTRPTKMFGLGLATAIFVDATLVRMVLVPATMTLLGDANWWLPRTLDRRLPSLRHDGEDLPSDQLVTLPS